MNQPFPQGQPGAFGAPGQQPPFAQMPPGHPYRPQGQPPPQQPTRRLADYFRTADRPGDAGGYFLMPMNLLNAMPPAWQDRMVQLLAEYHQQWSAAPWPERYKVEARGSRPVEGCDERQLAAVGIEADFDDDGDELVYRDTTTGETIEDPAARRILVPVADPVMDTK